MKQFSKNTSLIIICVLLLKACGTYYVPNGHNTSINAKRRIFQTELYWDWLAETNSGGDFFIFNIGLCFSGMIKDVKLPK